MNTRPHVTIIYVSGGALSPTLATPTAVDAWHFTPLASRPESDLVAIKVEAANTGALVVDNRTLPEQQPGMTSQTPVILCYKIPLWYAMGAVRRLETAIRVSAGNGQGMRRAKR